MGKQSYFNDLPFSDYNFADKNACGAWHLRYMLDRSARMFKWTGLPDTVPARMLEIYLHMNGNAFWMRHNGDLFVYTGGMGGEPDAYYRPTIYTIANPAQKLSINARIDTDGILMYNDSMLAGLMPLLARYANSLVENELSMWIADINSRIPAWISAADDRTRASAEQFLRDIVAGKLGIVADSKFLDGIKVQTATGANASHLSDLIEYEQYLRSGVWNDLGISANYNMKREAINSQEAQIGQDALLPFVDDMLACRQEAVDKVNNMFGTDIHVEFDSAWKVNEETMTEAPGEEVIEDERTTDPDGPVSELDD